MGKNWKDDKGNDNISPLCVSMNAAIEELLSDDDEEEALLLHLQ